MPKSIAVAPHLSVGELHQRYRRGHRIRTRDDEETEGDLWALALAACWLTDGAVSESVR